MTRIHIPAASLEAGARGIYEVMYPPQSHPAWEYARETLKEIFRGYARAAFEAMVKSWEGMQHIAETPRGQWTQNTSMQEHLILPLPQEARDD